jgi:hypothetical protein
VSRDEYPHTWLIREELPQVDDDEIFETALGFFMAGLIATAPRPCACGSH